MRRYIPLLLALFLVSCQPGQDTWFESQFNLTSFLKESAPTAYTEITFQVCDKNKKPLPYGLLRFNWEDNGGRMSFQTDDKGQISMKFEEDILESEIVVSIDEKPEGQVIIEAADYDLSTKPVPDGHIRVSW